MSRTTRKMRANRISAAALTLVLAGAISFSVACLPAAAQEQSVQFQTISSEQLAQRFKHKDFAFINVHVPYEGEIEQTDAFIPFDQIASNLDKLPSDKSAAIILYCRSGRMSEIAAATLTSLGYTNVAHLQGGFNAWAASGRVVLHH